MLRISVIPVILLLLPVINYAQVDQEKLDSLSRSINSSAKAFRNFQDSFTRIQDSIYQEAIGKSAGNHSANGHQFLAEQANQEEGERQRTLLRIFAGVVIVLIGVILWFLKKKTKT